MAHDTRLFLGCLFVGPGLETCSETHALCLTRVGRRIARAVLESIEASSTTIVRVAARDERRARELLRRYDDKDFSLTDCTSFAVMERLRIPQAFTFDCNFAQYGFPPLSLP